MLNVTPVVITKKVAIEQTQKEMRNLKFRYKKKKINKTQMRTVMQEIRKGQKKL